MKREDIAHTANTAKMNQIWFPNRHSGTMIPLQRRHKPSRPINFLYPRVEQPIREQQAVLNTDRAARRD